MDQTRRAERPLRRLPHAPLTVSRPKAGLVGMILQPGGAAQLTRAGKIQLDGDPSALAAYARLLDGFDLNFNIVTPDRPRREQPASRPRG